MINFLNKTGYLIVISILWVIFCIPVITAAAATTSLYYAVVKCVVHDRSYPVKEFFGSFKRTFLKGIPVSIIMVISAFSVYLYGQKGLLPFLLMLFLITGIFIFYFPVNSRFIMKQTDMFIMAITMVFRYIYISVPMAAVLIIIMYAVIKYFPLCLLIAPALTAYVFSFFIEKPLKTYMKKAKDDNPDSWYFE